MSKTAVKKKGRTFVGQSISFSPALLRSARERAAKLGMSFSRYVTAVVETDLAKRGALVFDEKVAPPAVESAQRKKHS